MVLNVHVSLQMVLMCMCHSTVLIDTVVCSLPTVMEVKVNLCLALFVSFLLNENYNKYIVNSYHKASLPCVRCYDFFVLIVNVMTIVDII